MNDSWTCCCNPAFVGSWHTASSKPGLALHCVTSVFVAPIWLPFKVTLLNQLDVEAIPSSARTFITFQKAQEEGLTKYGPFAECCPPVESVESTTIFRRHSKAWRGFFKSPPFERNATIKCIPLKRHLVLSVQGRGTPLAPQLRGGLIVGLPQAKESKKATHRHSQFWLLCSGLRNPYSEGF